MFDDDDDDDFNFDEFDEEEWRKIREEENNRVKALPIVRKAKELFQTICSFMYSIDEEKDIFEFRNQLFEDITIINTKIRAAEAADLYSLRMENAVLIKVHAQSILTATSGMEMFDISHEDYRQILRKEIDEFRQVFVEWVATFDRSNNFPDEWGLFS